MAFVRNSNHNEVDSFSMVDVAIAVDRIVDQCIKGTKYSFGGALGVGSSMKQFFVAVGGVPPMDSTA